VLEERPDSELSLSDAQRAAIASLSVEEVAEIDAALWVNTTTRWRKIAMVVATTMNGSDRWPELPDVYFSSRVRALVAEGRLEFQGFLEHMRFCEVRRPTSA
jgi:hypothetical protein